MLVRDVLRTKGGRVITIGPDATVAEAIRILVENNIGSLPVVDQAGALIGVISERDLLRGIHQGGEGFARRPVDQVMTRDPVTCGPEDDVQDVMCQMSSRRIAKVPVRSGNDLVGIVSVGDVIKVMYERVQAENGHLMGYLYGQV